MKKALKWLGIALLSPIVLFVVLTALLYVPPIQNWVAQQVASIASQKTGMDISVGHVDLRFPLDLSVDDVLVVKQGDTIADIGRTVVDLRLWSLLKGNIVVNELALSDARLNTLDFIDDVRIDGTIGTLTMAVPQMDAAALEMQLRHPHLSNADLTVYMSDTAAVDTTTVGWHIRFDRLNIDDTRLAVVVDSAARFDNADAMHIDTYHDATELCDADLHLGLARFIMGSVTWGNGRIVYNDVAAMNIERLRLDSLYSYGDDLRVAVADAAISEDSTGLALNAMHGRIAMSGDNLRLDSMFIDAAATFDGTPLSLVAAANGDMQRMTIDSISVSIADQLTAQASGVVTNINDTDRMMGQLKMSGQVLKTIKAGDVQMPRGLALKADIDVGQGRVNADVTARHAGGTATLHATMHDALATLLKEPQRAVYDARLSARSLDLRQFMPAGSIGLLTADMTLRGRGMPLDDKNTARIDGAVRVQSIGYATMQLDSIDADVTLNGSHATMKAVSRNDILRGSIDADGTVNSSGIDALIRADVPHADLKALGIESNPVVAGMAGTIKLKSNLKEAHTLQADINNMYISDTLKTHRPEDMTLALNTDADTTVVKMRSGDLDIRLNASGNYQQLISSMTALADTIAGQIKSRTIDHDQLKRLLPTASMTIESRKGNPLAGIMEASTGITFNLMQGHLTTSPQQGLNGRMELLGLDTDAVKLDTLRLLLIDRNNRLSFNGQVTNNKRNKTGAFNILFDGLMQQHGASMGVRYFDAQGQQNIRIGTMAEMVSIGSGEQETTGLRFKLIPNRPTLGYKEFALNDDNYVLMHDDMRIEANINLMADDGTNIMVYSGTSNDEEEQDSEYLQDLTISISSLDLGELTTGIVGLPSIQGKLNGDYHLIMDNDHSISVVSDMAVSKMAYEGSAIGNLGAGFVYMLREDGTHVVDAMLKLDEVPIGSLQGSYYTNETLDAKLTLDKMPLSIVNGFMPDQIIGFEGTTDGTLSVQGPTSKLMMGGTLTFSDAYMVSNPYGVRLKFGNQPLQIKDSRLQMDNVTLYADNSRSGDTPLTINGSIDLYGKGQEAVNLRVSTRNFQLINSKQKKESVAYGKMFVNLFARLTGNLEQLKLRGKLDVLGTTDLNYVLLDSPLNTDNQMDDLVRFTDFADTTQTVVVRAASEALDLDVQLGIDQGSHVRCALNAEQTNYVDLMGGGDLRLRIDADGLTLNGRYTINNGTMKYSLPIIPLKTFTLKEGSYVEFNGQPGNPTLNITATERQKAAVSNADGQSRNVSFDCGVVITQTLENMGLQFTIQAPEDTQVQSELMSMSNEQRGKLAVTMLTTGMYLADGNTGAFSMNTALSSFLQSEINSIAAGALKTVDLQLGLDNTTNAAGQTHTDYSFSFAKRFWDNRISVQLGGKVSTGDDMNGQQQSFFDNVTMEYRLSATGNKYVKLFYNQNVYDWLEGYTGEYGAGFIWKRKADSLMEIFKKKK